jgi:hypothetical protein
MPVVLQKPGTSALVFPNSSVWGVPGVPDDPGFRSPNYVSEIRVDDVLDVQRSRRYKSATVRTLRPLTYT